MQRIMLLSTTTESYSDAEAKAVHKKLLVTRLKAAERALLICCTEFPFADERTQFQLAVYLNDKYGHSAYWEDVPLSGYFAKYYSMNSHTVDDDERVVGSNYNVLLKAPFIVDYEVDRVDWLETFARWRAKLKSFHATRDASFETAATAALLKKHPFLKMHIKKFDADKMNRKQHS